MKKLLVASLVLSVAGAYAASTDLGQQSHSAKPSANHNLVSQTGNQTAVVTKEQAVSRVSETRQLTAEMKLYFELKERGSSIPTWLHEALFPQNAESHGLRTGGDSSADATAITFTVGEVWSDDGATTDMTDALTHDDVVAPTSCTSTIYTSSYVAPDAWYSFTLDGEYLVSASTCDADMATFDTVLAILDGDLNAVAINDDGENGDTDCGIHSYIAPCTLPAGDYYLVVDGYNNASGDYTIELLVDNPCEDFDCTGIDNEDEGIYTGAEGDVTNGGCNVTPPVFMDLAPNGEYCGTFFTFETEEGSSRDMDWFEFTLTEDSNVYFTGFSCGSYLMLLIDDNCGDDLTILEDITCPMGEATLDCGDMFAGTYRFVIAPSAFTGMPDEVSWHFEMTATPVTIENPCETAQELTCGSTLTGTNVGAVNYVGNAAGDVFYYFTLENAGLVEINLCDASTDYDSYLRLYDDCPISGGTQLAYDDDGPTCEVDTAPYEPSAIENVMLEAGTYWIVVEGLGENEGNFGVNLTCSDPCEPYDCTGLDNEDEGYYTDEDVTNGGCNLDNPVFSNIDCDGEVCGTMFTYITGEGTETRDMDWFEFTLLEDASVTFNGYACGVYNMWVLDNCDNLSTLGSATNQYGAGTVTAGPLYAGSYLFIIAPAGYTGMADETVWHVDMTCTPENIENPCDNATEITCGETYAGSTVGNMNYVGNNAGDAFFTFTMTAAGLVSFDLCDAGTDYDTYLSLYSGCPVDGGTLVGSNDDGPDCEVSSAEYPPSYLEVELTAGTYYVVVDGFSDNEGNYVLHFDCDDPCQPYDCTGLPEEGEGYYTDEDVTNGGCNLDTPIFSELACHAEICGTFFTYVTGEGTETRDMDWYEITPLNDETITFTGHACVTYNMWIIDNCNDLNVLDFTSGYGTQTLSLEVTAGSYICLIAPADYSGMADETEYHIELDCSVGVEQIAAPEAFKLGQNFPNPFNPTTTISWIQPEMAKATLTIHNILGEVVAAYDLGQRDPGQQSFVWNASDLASGVYLYTLTTAGNSATYKAVLLK